jgi:hypothetical protein
MEVDSDQDEDTKVEEAKVPLSSSVEGKKEREVVDGSGTVAVQVQKGLCLSSLVLLVDLREALP